MYKVDIYLAQSTASLSKDERWHGYVVACIKNGEEKTVNGFGHIFGTYHEATLSDHLGLRKRDVRNRAFHGKPIYGHQHKVQYRRMLTSD